MEKIYINLVGLPEPLESTPEIVKMNEKVVKLREQIKKHVLENKSSASLDRLYGPDVLYEKFLIEDGFIDNIIELNDLYKLKKKTKKFRMMCSLVLFDWTYNIPFTSGDRNANFIGIQRWGDIYEESFYDHVDNWEEYNQKFIKKNKFKKLSDYDAYISSAFNTINGINIRKSLRILEQVKNLDSNNILLKRIKTDVAKILNNLEERSKEKKNKKDKNLQKGLQIAAGSFRSKLLSEFNDPWMKQSIKIRLAEKKKLK